MNLQWMAMPGVHRRPGMNSRNETEKRQDLDPGGEMTLLEHLTELRRRLIYSLSAVLIMSIAAYGFADEILEILARPLLSVLPQMQNQLIFTSLAEVFIVQIKLSVFVGILAAVPVIMYQIWLFISCALHREEKRFLVPFVLVSTLFFILGTGFCYFIVFPWAFRFFISFTTESLIPLISLKDYFKFVTRMILVFGCVFEMPIAAAFLSAIGLLTPGFLKKNRRYAILIVFIIAAILTPPDAITQLLLATPMMLLYELSVWAAVLFSKR